MACKLFPSSTNGFVHEHGGMALPPSGQLHAQLRPVIGADVVPETVSHSFMSQRKLCIAPVKCVCVTFCLVGTLLILDASTLTSIWRQCSCIRCMCTHHCSWYPDRLYLPLSGRCLRISLMSGGAGWSGSYSLQNSKSLASCFCSIYQEVYFT